MLPRPDAPLPPAIEEDEPELADLKQKIQRDRGFNCAHYKEKCLRRRIAVRMRARGLNRFAEYAGLLDRDPAEYELLMDALTINVTKFFRNAETWKVIANSVLPVLFEARRPFTRIWSAGCSSGEEPYSVSMLLHDRAEQQGNLADLRHFRITGTDIDRR